MSENPVFGFTPFKRAPAYQVVSDKIREAILDGRIPAGKLLPTETALAEQFGVTRSTVREAIRLLEQSGLLGRAGRKRLEVRLPSLESASRSVNAATPRAPTSSDPVTGMPAWRSTSSGSLGVSA